MPYNILQRRIYEYAINVIAKEIGLSQKNLIDKVNGQEEFTGTEVIKISDIIKIDNPEKFFCNDSFYARNRNEEVIEMKNEVHQMKEDLEEGMFKTLEEQFFSLSVEAKSMMLKQTMFYTFNRLFLL